MTTFRRRSIGDLRAHVAPMFSPSLRRLLRFYGRIVTRGDLCFDIGANRGGMTELFRRLGARVVSVEPQAQCLHVLEDKYSHDDSITIVPLAISNETGETTLKICNVDEMTSMSEEFVSHYAGAYAYRWDSVLRIQTTTLDALIAGFGLPSFCVIDVEGHESKVLGGLTRAIPQIRFEYHQALAKNNVDSIECLISLADYRFNFSTNEQLGFDLDEWVGPESILSEINRAKKNGHVYATCSDANRRII